MSRTRSAALGSTAIVYLGMTVAGASLLDAVVAPANATTFSITTANTTARTLGATAGEFGNVSTSGSLTVSGSTVAVTITGNNETINNLGNISQTGTGRVVRDNTGVTNLIINNGSPSVTTAIMQSADADVIQMNKSPASVTLNNYGTLNSLNASKGGAQAVDFAAIQSGNNTINNFSTGNITALDADAVRPGVNGIVNNSGLIKSTITNDTGTDGVDVQNNSGVQIFNGVGNISATIEGARHGITGGAGNATVSFTTSITNYSGSIITGKNGSGINLDGFNGNQTATIVNNGTITGQGVTGDGDGVDVDGLVNITNTGIIRSINACCGNLSAPAFSEGATVGGGNITNSGTIEGLAAGNVTNVVRGRGITLAGNDVAGGPPGTREAIYGNATIVNQSGGLIKGQNDSGIVVEGPASGFTITISNESGATVMGGGTATAAIQTGADNDTVNNWGAIDGSSSNKAVALGAGNDALNLYTGSSVLGTLDGGNGADALHLLGTGTGSLTNTANFETLNADGGTWTLSGSQSYTGGVAIANAATLVVSGQLAGDVSNNGTVEVTSGSATFTGTFTNNGALISDPSTLTFDDLAIGSSGYLTAGLGDIFDIKGNFINESTDNADWNTVAAKLGFIGASGTAHNLELNAFDYGAVYAGYTDNFAWGALGLDPGNILILLNTSGDAAYDAFYTGLISGLQFDSGNPKKIDNIIGNGFDMYYDPSLAGNAYLHNRRYILTDGGYLTPIGFVVPEPGTLAVFGIGLIGLGARYRRTKRGLSPDKTNQSV